MSNENDARRTSQVDGETLRTNWAIQVTLGVNEIQGMVEKENGVVTLEHPENPNIEISLSENAKALIKEIVSTEESE